MIGRRVRIIALFSLACLVFICPQAVRSQGTEDIWLVPQGGANLPPDFFDLFDDGAAWQQAGSHVKVFELSVAILTKSSDAELKKVFDGLRKRHIALALDMLPLTGHGPGKCGFHVEGYSAENQTYSIAQRVKSLGGNPSFYDMDEPLYFGHLYNGNNACRSSIADVAADVARKIQQVRTVFPSIKIGESEPIMDISKEGMSNLAQWLDAFQAATGSSLSFLRFDMDWNAPWQERVGAIAQLLRRKSVYVQVIYNGSGRDQSDDEWVTHALEHAAAFESVLKPDSVAIQSWNVYPRHVLPDSAPTTLTGLVNRYASSDRRPGASY
jgi:hypothetical protein